MNIKDILLTDKDTSIFICNIIFTSLALLPQLIITNSLYLFIYINLYIITIYLKIFIECDFKFSEFNSTLIKNKNLININVLILPLIISKILESLISQKSLNFFIILKFLIILILIVLILTFSIKPINKLSKKIDGNSEEKINVISFYSFLFSSLIIIIYIYFFITSNKTFTINFLDINLNVKSLFYQIFIFSIIFNVLVSLVSSNKLTNRKNLNERHRDWDIICNLICTIIVANILVFFSLYLLNLNFYNNIKLIIISILLLLRLFDNTKNITSKDNLLNYIS